MREVLSEAISTDREHLLRWDFFASLKESCNGIGANLRPGLDQARYLAPIDKSTGLLLHEFACKGEEVVHDFAATLVPNEEKGRQDADLDLHGVFKRARDLVRRDDDLFEVCKNDTKTKR